MFERVYDPSNEEPAVDITLKRLGKAAFAVIGDEGATNFGIVRGDGGAALLIDADIRRIDEIEEALRQTQCSSVKYLFITHENFDHSSANDYFEKNGTVVIGSQGCHDALKDDGDDKFAEMAGRSPELFRRFPGLKMRLPHIVFPDGLTVQLPGATVHLRHYEQGHSRGDATAYFAQEDVFFAGDLLYTEVHPVTIYGRLDGWIKSLVALQQISFGTIVPGHGPVGDSQAEGRQQLKKFQDYLTDFNNRLGEITAGRKSGPRTVEEMYESYPSLGKRWMVKRNVDYFLKHG
jgi:glyoxylase-like metal-dependent hydrolase (beta-lactamase superfamily II)